MDCTSMEQAKAVAIAGARKMDEQGYAFSRIGETTCYEVMAPGQAIPYLVETDPEMVDFLGGKFCTCPFAAANIDFGTCKHFSWILSKIEEDKKIAAMEAEEQAWQEFAEARDMAIANRVMREAGIPHN